MLNGCFDGRPAPLRLFHSPFTIYYSPIMNVLVLNCGSSTVKFQIISTDLDRIAQDTDERLARGQVERVGGEAIITFEAEGRAARRSTGAGGGRGGVGGGAFSGGGGGGGGARRSPAPVRDTRAAVETIIRWVTSSDS